MRKLAPGITAAIVFLLANVLAWNVEATTLSGLISTQPGTNSSLLETVDCDSDAICPLGTLLSCSNPGGPDPQCECASCPEPGTYEKSETPDAAEPQAGIAAEPQAGIDAAEPQALALCPCPKPWPNTCVYRGTLYKCR